MNRDPDDEAGREPIRRGRALPPWAASLAIWTALLAIPIVPFALLGEDAFLHLLDEKRGRAAVSAACFALLLSDVLLPVPSSLVAMVSGAMLGPLGGTALNWIAIVSGNALAFGLARRWGRPLALRLLGEGSLGRADEAWRAGAVAALALSRPIPVLAEAIAMDAGLRRMPPRRFLAVAAAANLPHAAIYAWAGARMKDGDALFAATVAAVGIPTIAWAIFRGWRHTRADGA